MNKKLILLVFFGVLTLNSSAQWRITGCDRSDADNFELLQIIELDSATFIYGTLTNPQNDVYWASLNRKTCIYADDEQYKLVSSVNLPVRDEADMKWVRLDQPGQKVNFVMVFEKFPVQDGFDLIENEKDDKARNLYGIHVEEIQPSEVIKTKRFISSDPVVTQGVFADQGTNHRYYIRDGVSIDCCATTRSGDVFCCDDIIFTLDIINESDHGIRFDFSDGVWITGTKKKANGTTESRSLAKYNPEGYEQYLLSQDYEEAKYATSGGLAFLDSKLQSASHRYGNSDWEKAGYKMLSSLTEQVMDNNIQEYLKKHPKNRPSAMKSQSIKSGDSYAGYVAGKTKNMDSVILHVKMDEYEFEFLWDLTKQHPSK